MSFLSHSDCLLSKRQRLINDAYVEVKMEDNQNTFCALLCVTVLHTRV